MKVTPVDVEDSKLANFYFPIPSGFLFSYSGQMQLRLKLKDEYASCDPSVCFFTGATQQPILFKDVLVEKNVVSFLYSSIQTAFLSDKNSIAFVGSQKCS